MRVNCINGWIFNENFHAMFPFGKVKAVRTLAESLPPAVKVLKNRQIRFISNQNSPLQTCSIWRFVTVKNNRKYIFRF